MRKMLSLFVVLLAILLATACQAQSTSFQKTITNWPDGWGPALPYHVLVESDSFWYDIKWDGKTIVVKSSIERDYAKWTDDQWRELINWCYVDNDDLRVSKL
jgi:putative cell wall-binding protein